jgi:transcription elongation factor GreA
MLMSRISKWIVPAGTSTSTRSPFLRPSSAYTIVAEHEANLREGKLAIGTPIAKALLGRKKGDRVDVEVPAGTIHFEILDISI